MCVCVCVTIIYTIRACVCLISYRRVYMNAMYTVRIIHTRVVSVRRCMCVGGRNRDLDGATRPSVDRPARQSVRPSVSRTNFGAVEKKKNKKDKNQYVGVLRRAIGPVYEDGRCIIIIIITRGACVTSCQKRRGGRQPEHYRKLQSSERYYGIGSMHFRYYMTVIPARPAR